MKKQLIIVGMIILLVCVGLSGCNGNGETSISDIKGHANNYINHTVTIRAYYYSGIVGGSVYIIQESSSSYIYAINPDNVVKPTLVSGSQYKFTGIVRYGNPPGNYNLLENVYLEVTKIETV